MSKKNADRLQIEFWMRRYADDGAIPIAEVQKYLMMDRASICRRTFTISHTTGRIANKRTGKTVTGVNLMLHQGGKAYCITPERAHWFILIGTDPAIVGKDKTGLYGADTRGGPKTYALDLMKRNGDLGGPIIPSVRARLGIYDPIGPWSGEQFVVRGQ